MPANVTLHNVIIRKVVYTAAKEKISKDGEDMTRESVITITLEVTDSAIIKDIIDFAESGPVDWQIGRLQKVLS
jgi:hypothetical protein